jgi:hypothetical protein
MPMLTPELLYEYAAPAGVVVPFMLLFAMPIFNPNPLSGAASALPVVIANSISTFKEVFIFCMLLTLQISCGYFFAPQKCRLTLEIPPETELHRVIYNLTSFIHNTKSDAISYLANGIADKNSAGAD